jgi:hypothetical protein
VRRQAPQVADALTRDDALKAERDRLRALLQKLLDSPADIFADQVAKIRAALKGTPNE